ncbi:hypothetical protein GHT06_011936 [Daphnia sinensis]|uniref:Uncharacterized protein n=1 Tax=Daphnia sinensis TaxID=1820382 RepID=A0AAD5LE04_9CRUS|nr:hypothetical protein GHT06_011936 [Daphnia sinensis]
MTTKHVLSSANYSIEFCTWFCNWNSGSALNFYRMAEGFSWAQKLSRFTKRNIVMIVMVPTLVSIHWGWTKLQEVERFVPKNEKMELPIIRGIKTLTEANNSATPEQTEVK